MNEGVFGMGGITFDSRYPRERLRPGIVHFGVGGFHRAHQAMYLDRLMTGTDAHEWAIVGVGVMPGDIRMRDALREQDYLYTLVVKHPDGRLEPTTIGSIIDYRYAPDDPEAVLTLLTDPAIRIVSLTVTEGGYHVHPVTGELDLGDEALAHDLARQGSPRTVFGYIVEGLLRRRAAGIPPFTVMSCDNLPGNGDVARKMITAFAERLDPDLATWISSTVAFPNSMVDRITPATTEQDIVGLEQTHGIDDRWPVICEPFTQWVLEDRFVTGRPPLERVGVQVVDDVVPYELMKLRLLNGSHQAMAYLGYLAGYEYVHEVCQDADFVSFLLGYMAHEATPTLPEVPGVDLDTYRHQLIERFGNPAVRDTVVRLCAETSDRIPQWLRPVIEHNLATGGPVERCALIVASWARYADGVDEQGRPIDVVDRRREQVMAAASRNSEDPLSFLRDRELFGDLVADQRFTDAYVRALGSLRDHGARATLAALVAAQPAVPDGQVTAR